MPRPVVASRAPAWDQPPAGAPARPTHLVLRAARLRLAPDDTALLRAHPKLLIGYSDVTTLHALWSREGVPSFHAPMPDSDWLADGGSDDAQALLALLMQPLTAGASFGPVPTEAWRARVPYTLVLVDLDEGVRLMSRVEGLAPEAVTVGLRVRARVVVKDGRGLVVFDPEVTA